MFEKLRRRGLPDPHRLEYFKERLCQRIFIDSADEDYLFARLAWRMQAINQFAWSSSQAIEKYLKCALLLNGERADFNHSFSSQFKKVFEISNGLIASDVVRPTSLDVFLGFEDQFPESIFEVVDRFSKNGSPNQRYRQVGLEIEPYDLYKLDHLCWSIRRVCVPLDQKNDDGIPWRDFLKDNPKKFTYVGGLSKEYRSILEISDLLLDTNFAMCNDPDQKNINFGTAWKDTAFRVTLPDSSGHYDVNFVNALAWLVENSRIKPQDVETVLVVRGG